jgi:hypothetical protein
MSKTTVSAAGVAMPAEGQPNPGHEHRLELLNIENHIDEVRHLLEAAWMAVNSMEVGDEQAALHTLITITQGKLTDARDRLSAARIATLEGHADV